MDRIDVTDGFDVHDYREALKLLSQDRERTVFENRESLGCPACGEIFDRLVVTAARTASLGDPPGPVCLARTDEELLVVVH